MQTRKRIMTRVVYVIRVTNQIIECRQEMKVHNITLFPFPVSSFSSHRPSPRQPYYGHLDTVFTDHSHDRAVTVAFLPLMHHTDLAALMFATAVVRDMRPSILDLVDRTALQVSPVAGIRDGATVTSQ